MSFKMYSKNVVVSFIKTLLVKKLLQDVLLLQAVVLVFKNTNTIFRTTSLIRLSGSTEARL